MLPVDVDDTDTGDVPRAGLCPVGDCKGNCDRPPATAAAPGGNRLSICCCKFCGIGGGVDGVEEQRGGGGGGASLNCDGHGDGEY